MNTISVIVPIYNAEAYLAKCIESLIHQTHRALQIILVNDGSTDDSLTIAQQFAADDQRIQVYSQPNQGQAAARNLGIQYASGEWISFVDADDYIDTQHYAQLLLHTQDADVILHGYQRETPEGTILYQRIPSHPYRYTAPWLRMYKREWLVQNAINFPVGMFYEDVVFTVDMWLISPRYIIVPQTTYHYLQHATSTTATSHQIDQQRLFLILRKKLHDARFIHKLLIVYTIIRLKFHFKRYD